MNLFRYKDYIALNKLQEIGENEAKEDWVKTGSIKLCNIAQLDVINEFGNEMVLYIPYYFYLHQNGLLHDNKIKTFRGMRDLYYFLNRDQIIEKTVGRTWVPEPYRPLPSINRAEYQLRFDTKCWTTPPYKKVFSNTKFVYDKPLLIVHNKYNYEWLKPPVNFIPVPLLDTILTALKPSYQIVYIRPSFKFPLASLGYSLDENKIVELQDFEMINDKHPEVLIFDDIVKREHLAYNSVKLMLYANADNFICVQGGNSYFAAYFIGKMLILHKKGDEVEKGVYTKDGWFYQMNDELNKEVRVTGDETEFINHLSMFMDKRNEEKDDQH